MFYLRFLKIREALEIEWWDLHNYWPFKWFGLLSLEHLRKAKQVVTGMEG